MDQQQRVALIVAYDRAIRSSVGGWLEQAGFDVLLCSGPGRPEYRCIAGNGADCPLATSADLIVLDAWLESDADDAGMTAPDLIRYYRSRGKPLLVLDHGRRRTTLIAPERTALLEWPPRRSEVEAFAHALTSTSDGLDRDA